MFSLKTKRIIVLVAGLLILIISLSADYIRTGSFSFQGVGIKQMTAIIIGAILFFRVLILLFQRTPYRRYLINNKYNVSKKSPFWSTFRLVYVIFFLYLIGDAFYRWDGFRLHSSFLEFLSNLALITTLWGIISFVVSITIWFIFRVDEWVSETIGWKTNTDTRRLILLIFLSSGFAVWLIKRPILYYGVNPDEITTTAFYFFLLSMLVAWIVRKKSEKWMRIIDEKISPLVSGFGIAFVISLFVVVSLLWSYKFGHKMLNDKTGTSSIISEKSSPNILLITFDALAAEDMSLYGYHRETTPFLNKWAKGASLFTRVEAASNCTRPTTASLMTGKRFWTHQAHHIQGSYELLNVQTENLPLLLMNHGYYNIALIGNYFASVDILGIKSYFDYAPKVSEFIAPVDLVSFLDLTLHRLFSDKYKLYNWLISDDFIFRALVSTFSTASVTTAPIDKIVNKFLEVIDSNSPEPFFAWIHFWPPHTPYLPPEQYSGLFADMSASEQDASSRYNNRDLYNEYIRYCDSEFENFITQLEIRGKLRNTIIIVSSDHGESFEHDYIGHCGEHLWESVTWIPLIIKKPGQTEGRVIHELSQQIDIPATILDIVNIPVPSWMEGRSLVPLMRGEKIAPKPAFSMALKMNKNREYKITKGTIAIWEGDYKLMHYLEEQKTLLFNLKKDPKELKNIFNENHEIGNQLLTLLLEELAKANDRLP
jgi:arylsulfatase